MITFYVRMASLFGTLMLLAAPALADGPSSIPGDQCDEVFVPLEYPGFPPDVVAEWNAVGLAAWKDACAPRLTMFTDEEKIHFLLSGHHVPPAQVPLTGSIYMMILALAMLLGWRKA
jgi:hypothetical protein